MKNYFTLAFCLVLLPLQAQVTISRSDIAYQKGDRHSFRPTDPMEMVTNISPETAGANVIWDFSSPNASFLEGTTAIYVDPATTPFADSVGDANLCIKSEGSIDGSYQFLRVTDEGLEHLYMAWYESGITSFSTYSHPLTALKFPITYGQTFEEDYAVRMIYQGSLFMVDSSSTSVEVDAYGTVTTPAGTFTDVLRMKRTTTSIGYTYYEGEFISTGDYSTIDYCWFKPGIHTSLITVSKFVGEDSYMVIYLSNPQVTGMDSPDAEASFRAFPNPVGEWLNIEHSSGPIETYVLLDASGRTILRGTGSGSPSQRLYVGQLDPGVYVIQVASKGVSARRKILLY